MKLYWPVRVEDGVFISQRFGEHLLDYSQFGLIGHNGIDYPATRGTKIYAPHDGWIVEQMARDTGYGLRITQRIEADGKFYMAVYGHMERLEKPQDLTWDWNYKGYPVRAGQVIGYVDSTGFSTGHHLHFGLFEMDSNWNRLNISNGYAGAIDPAPFMAGEMEKPSMTKYFKIDDHGKLGIMILEGFTGSILFENKFIDYQNLLKLIEGISEDTPTIKIP